MTFELMRMGWPNTAAIAALAMMPIVALTTITDRRPNAEHASAASICQTPAACTVVAAAAAVDTTLE